MAATFPQATAAEMQPMTLHTNSTPNDATEWLPAKAANRLRALRESFEELHAVTTPFEQIREASVARFNAEQRLTRLTDHAHDHGFSLSADDPRVIDAQKLVSITGHSLSGFHDNDVLSVGAAAVAALRARNARAAMAGRV